MNPTGLPSGGAGGLPKSNGATPAIEQGGGGGPEAGGSTGIQGTELQGQPEQQQHKDSTGQLITPEAEAAGEAIDTEDPAVKSARELASQLDGAIADARGLPITNIPDLTMGAQTQEDALAKQAQEPNVVPVLDRNVVRPRDDEHEGVGSSEAASSASNAGTPKAEVAGSENPGELSNQGREGDQAGPSTNASTPGETPGQMDVVYEEQPPGEEIAADAGQGQSTDQAKVEVVEPRPAASPAEPAKDFPRAADAPGSEDGTQGSDETIPVAERPKLPAQPGAAFPPPAEEQPVAQNLPSPEVLGRQIAVDPERLESYTKARRDIQIIEAEQAKLSEGESLSPDQQAKLDAARAKAQKIENDSTKEVENLGKNPEYQQKRQQLDDSRNDRWRDIDALPQEEQDKAIENLSKSDRKAYEQYVDNRERVRVTEEEAAFQVREENIAQLPPGEQAAKRKQLELDRTVSIRESTLRRDYSYQALKRTNGMVEDALTKTINPGEDTEEKGLTEQQLRELPGTSWKDLPQGSLVRRRFLSMFNNDVAMAEREFNRYVGDRAKMNSSERNASDQATSERLGQGYAADGTRLPEDPKKRKELMQQRIEQSQSEWDKSNGPSPARQGFNAFMRKFDDWFGEAGLNEHRKAAFGWSRRLIGMYGWKGLPIFDRLLKKEDREQAKILRGKIWEEGRKWLAISGRRKLLFGIALLALYWFVLPIAMGKLLEATKPFGGNG